MERHSPDSPLTPQQYIEQSQARREAICKAIAQLNDLFNHLLENELEVSIAIINSDSPAEHRDIP